MDDYMKTDVHVNYKIEIVILNSIKLKILNNE